MNGYLSYNGLQRFWSKVKSYIDNKFNEASSTTPKQTYSTEEHVVGTWIDGRDIYEISFSGVAGTGSTTYVFTNISMTKLISVNAGYGPVVISGEIESYIPLPYGGGSNYVYFNKGVNQLVLNIGTNTWRGKEYNVTLRYLKN